MMVPSLVNSSSASIRFANPKSVIRGLAVLVDEHVGRF